MAVMAKTVSQISQHGSVRYNLPKPAKTGTSWFDMPKKFT